MHHMDDAELELDMRLRVHAAYHIREVFQIISMS